MTMKEVVRRKVAAGEFKAKCLALLDEVELQHQHFVVTKRGRPVAQVIPLPVSAKTSLIGTVVYEQDLLSPVDVKWDAGR
jgi:prevent-host-death family protein